MSFPIVTEQNHSKVRYLVRESDQVFQSARALSAKLKDIFERSHPKEYWGVSFEVLEPGHSANIETRFGAARASTTIHVNEDGIYGRYLIEKQKKDDRGELVWVAAWVIRISSEGVVYPGESGGDPVDVRDNFFPGGSDNDTVRLAMSLLYSIGAN